MFRKFLEKYAGEVSAVGTALGAIVSVLPIGGDDKKKVRAVIDQLEGAAASIVNGLDDLPDAPADTYDREAIDDKIRAAEIRLIAELDKRREGLDAALDAAEKARASIEERLTALEKVATKPDSGASTAKGSGKGKA